MTPIVKSALELDKIALDYQIDFRNNDDLLQFINNSNEYNYLTRDDLKNVVTLVIEKTRKYCFNSPSFSIGNEGSRVLYVELNCKDKDKVENILNQIGEASNADEYNSEPSNFYCRYRFWWD